MVGFQVFLKKIDINLKSLVETKFIKINNFSRPIFGSSDYFANKTYNF